MFNVFSGGAVSRMAIFALGNMPYISSSIIVQLLTGVSDYFKNLKLKVKLEELKLLKLQDMEQFYCYYSRLWIIYRLTIFC